jgi:hypothetical protein
MRVYQIVEANSAAVMAFGRMNPPTIGHKKLVDTIKGLPGDPYIFLSQSQKPKTDPLDFQTKLRYAKFFFPDLTIGNPEVKTIIQALQKINSLGYKNLIYVAGSDRVQSFEELINKYNGVEYNFDSIKVVSAGERDPDADGAEGMSASKMRAAAASGNFDSFAQGVPNQELAHEMFAAVRKGMGIKDKEAVPAESMEEQTVEPNKLLAFITFVSGQGNKEYDLTPIMIKNNWVGTPKQVVTQAEKWLADFLRQRGDQWTSIQFTYNGMKFEPWTQVGDVGVSDPELDDFANQARQRLKK